MHRYSALFACVILAAMPIACGSSGGGSSAEYVEANDLEGGTGIAIDSVFRYTFDEAVDATSVTDETLFIVADVAGTPSDDAAKQEAPEDPEAGAFDEALCNSENALAATTNCPTTTTCTVNPSADLEYGTRYAFCASPSIALSSGSSFSGFTAHFLTELDPTPCDNTGVETYAYLMSFQACTEDCSDPRNHMVYLAGSDDGLVWSLIDDFDPIAGSVPALVYYNDELYIFHTQGRSSWQKYNACFGVVESGDAVIDGTDVNGWVDPSPIVSGENLVLVYLPAQADGDPASCGSGYPCTREIHAAVADADIAVFTQETTALASHTIESAESEVAIFADPDILQMPDGSYVLYVSAGGTTLVYTGTSLDSAFSSPDPGAEYRIISTYGGVPGALVAPNGEAWLFVTRNDMAGGSSIYRGTSEDGVTAIEDAGFAAVITSDISSSFTEDTNIGSPSVITWPDTDWTRQRGPATP